MSNYTKITDFGAKDSLISGDPLKVIRGSEIDDEFDAIATAVATKYDTATANTALDAKADLAGDTFTGPVVLPAGSAAAPSLTFVSDTDTGIYSSGANTLDFSTGGAQRVSINSTGKVGIGTSPNTLAMLSVEGVSGWTASGWYKAIRLPETRTIQFTSATKHYGVGASGDEFYIFTTTAEDGSASANYIARFYTSGQLGIPAQYSNTTASAPNCVVDTTGIIYRSTSSRKYKEQIEDLYPAYANKILEFRPVWYRSKADRDRKDWSYYGFIAEEIAEIEPRFVEFRENEDGTLEPEGIQYDRMVVPLVALVQQQQKQIEALEARLAVLEAK